MEFIFATKVNVSWQSILKVCNLALYLSIDPFARYLMVKIHLYAMDFLPLGNYTTSYVSFLYKALISSRTTFFHLGSNRASLIVFGIDSRDRLVVKAL